MPGSRDGTPQGCRGRGGGESRDSAVEAAVDRISLENPLLAKRAKDVGSAAVMRSLINVPVVWLLVLFG